MAGTKDALKGGAGMGDTHGNTLLETIKPVHSNGIQSLLCGLPLLACVNKTNDA